MHIFLIFVSVRMCTHVCACVYTIFAHSSACECVYAHASVRVNAYVWMCVCVFLPVHAHVYVGVLLCARVYFLLFSARAHPLWKTSRFSFDDRLKVGRPSSNQAEVDWALRILSRWQLPYKESCPLNSTPSHPATFFSSSLSYISRQNFVKDHTSSNYLLVEEGKRIQRNHLPDVFVNRKFGDISLKNQKYLPLTTTTYHTEITWVYFPQFSPF